MSVGTIGSPVIGLPAAARPATRPSPGWLLRPGLDLLFVANILWPLLAWFSAQYKGMPAASAVGFLVAYFLIMPHRWITLALVFLDRDRFRQNSRSFLTVAGLIVVGTTLSQVSLGALTLLLAIDYVWNGWHFAAQHGGIARMYDRMARPERQSTGRLDKYVLRTLVLFAVFRLAGSTMPQIERGREWLQWITPVMAQLSVLDYVVICLPLVLLVREFLDFRRSAIGRIVYLVSVSSLYGLMILASRWENIGLRLGCAAAATLFHSVEYLAIVTWYVGKNKGLQKSAPFSYLVPRWAICLVAFMSCCALSAFLWKEKFFFTWIWINLIVSFLHYAYDGMIWKGPKKKVVRTDSAALAASS